MCSREQLPLTIRKLIYRRRSDSTNDRSLNNLHGKNIWRRGTDPFER